MDLTMDIDILAVVLANFNAAMVLQVGRFLNRSISIVPFQHLMMKNKSTKYIDIAKPD